MKRKHFILITVLLLIGLSAATQIAAHRMAYRPELSGRIYAAEDRALYAPWSLIVWSIHRSGEQAVLKQTLWGYMIYALAVVGAAGLGIKRSTPAIKPFGAEGWGTRRDMKRAGLLSDRGSVLGLYQRRLMTYDGPEHQLVSGATRSGKGVGHVVPTLLCWPHSCVVYDVKAELWEMTAGCRSHHQHCVFFNPTRLDGARFNPMFEIRKGPNEVRDSQNLVEMLINPDGAKKTFDVWDQNTFQFLTALVLHVLYTEPVEQKHLGRVRELLLDFDKTCQAMMTTPHRLDRDTGEVTVDPEIARVAKSLLTQAHRFRSSVRGTAEGYLTLWADRTVCEVTSTSDFAIGDLVCLDRPVTLYLQPPPSDADRVRPLIRLILNQIARALMEDQNRDGRGREKRHRLLLLVDEFPTLGRLPFFSESLRQMAGYGIKAQLIVQSFNDITEAYGPHNTIIDNCHVLCCFASADTTTQQRISAMTGEAVEYRESYSRPRRWSFDGKRSVSHSEQVRPLLRPGDVRTLSQDEQLVFVTGFKPFRTEKLRFHECPPLQKRVLAPPDASASAGRLRSAGTSGDRDWRDEEAKGDPLPLPEELTADSEDRDEQPAPSRSARPGTTDHAVEHDHEPQQGEFL